MYVRFVRSKPFIAGVIVAAVFLPVGIAYGYTTGAYGSGAYGACVYGEACSITLSSNGSIGLNIMPTASGSCTVQSDSVSVLTDDTDGYILTLADNGNNTSLSNGPNTISATSGTFSNPSTLSGNNWGYRVDGAGGFGSGPTNAQTNGSRSGTLFAGIEPNSEGGDTIASTSVPADPEVTTTVWYGVCADTTVGSGQYTTQVVYTAVAN